MTPYAYPYEPCGSTVKSLTAGTETIAYGHDRPLTCGTFPSGRVVKIVGI